LLTDLLGRIFDNLAQCKNCQDCEGGEKC